MIRPLVTAAALALGLALPAHALDLDNLSEAERATLHDEIRAYLLQNPEVIMEAVAVLEERQNDGQAQADEALIRANADAIFDDGHSWIGGNPDGDVTMVEFMDYRCGYCRRAAAEVESLLRDDGDIRFIVKEFPILGEESLRASRFAIATKQVAGDDAYKSVHDALMTYNGTMNEAGFIRLADSLGLDANAIIARMDSDSVSDVIAANHALAQELQINGTPSFVVAEQMLRGFVPQDAMQQVVNDIRAN